MDHPPCLDPNTLQELIKLGGKEFALRLIDIFFSYVPGKLGEARAAEQAGDIAGVEQAVHPIKSSASNIGALALRDLAARIEQLAVAKEGRPIPPLLRDLEAAYAEVAALLQEKRRELAG